MNNKDVYVNLEITEPYVLYNAICKSMCFNDVIELYKYLKYKIENLDDKVMDYSISTAGYFREVENGEN